MARRIRPQISTENPVPLHRSYGVTKKEGFSQNSITCLQQFSLLFFFSLLAVTWVLGIYILISILGAIGVMLISVAALLFVYFKLCRKLRKRARFIFRLKRRCKQMGYKLKFHRGFFKGLRFNKDGFDFTVNTGKKIWSVSFFTPKKYLSHLTFVDSRTVDIKTNIIQSRLKFILGLNNPRLKRIEYVFDDKPTEGEKNTAKALIVNPVPHDVFKKDADGAVIPIGTGERLYGYTLFTGSGFLETLMREDDN